MPRTWRDRRLRFVKQTLCLSFCFSFKQIPKKLLNTNTKFKAPIAWKLRCSLECQCTQFYTLTYSHTALFGFFVYFLILYCCWVSISISVQRNLLWGERKWKGNLDLWRWPDTESECYKLIEHSLSSFSLTFMNVQLKKALSLVRSSDPFQLIPCRTFGEDVQVSGWDFYQNCIHSFSLQTLEQRRNFPQNADHNGSSVHTYYLY